MNNNCNKHNCDSNINKLTQITLPETNISAASLHIHIGSLSVAGVELKEVACDINSTITDKNVEVQCDFVGKMIGQLIAKFGDSINTNIDVDAECGRARVKRIEAETETELARKAYYEAEAETEKARKAQIDAEIEKMNTSKED